MTTIYLVRHAEAEGNVYRRCHGQYDSLLTNRAVDQLPYLADRFDEIELSAVYASDLYRARHTAKAIADRKDLKVRIRRDLREIDMCDWEDRPWAELKRFENTVFTQWSHEPWDCTIPGGEGVMQTGARVYAALQELARRHDGQSIAVVSHGTAIRGVLTLAHGLKPEQMNELGWGDNTCVAKLEFDGERCTPVYWNDAAHLPERFSTFASIGWKDNKDVPRTIQLWFREADLNDPADCALLRRYAREFYMSAYGSTELLDEDAWMADTAEMAKTPRAVTIGMLEDEPAALVRLNVVDDSEPGVGKLGSFIIEEKYRGCGLSPQILGQAISVYRELGKDWFCAYVAVRNGRAQGFYRKYGFRNVGIHTTACGDHFTMMKPIKVPSVLEQADDFDLSEY